jgi:SnoaL-like domain
MSDLEARLARLEAERDIAALMATYARLVDEGPDADAIVALFTADAVYETFGQLGLEGEPITGRDALHSTFRDLPQLLPFTAHYLCNPEVTVSADVARGEGRWLVLELANAVRDDDRQALVMVAAYHNDFVRTPDGWLIERIRFGDLRAFPYAEGFARTRYVSMYDGHRVED